MLVKGCYSQLLHSSSCIPHSTPPLGHYSLFPLISSSFLFTPGLFSSPIDPLSFRSTHSTSSLSPSLSLLLRLYAPSSLLPLFPPHASVVVFLYQSMFGSPVMTTVRATVPLTVLLGSCNSITRRTWSAYFTFRFDCRWKEQQERILLLTFES